jgi:hypothetical protein
VKALITVLVAGVLLGGTVFTDRAEAGDRKGHRRGHVQSRYYGHRGYFRDRDVVVIRDYYRPYYRPVPRSVHVRYVRGGYLPYGWERRVVPVPVYLEPRLVAVPYGYHRGIIDGHAVVYNPRGLIVDVAVLF